MISLARTSSFCWVSPCTFCRSVAPRISASPALRTLFAIILAASARSYSRPDSSPVASGCSFSCSMINRSIVTTEVAVCFTTSCILFGTSAGRAGEAAGSVTPGVGLVAIRVISPPQTLPKVTNGESFALRELLHVSELVKKQTRIGASPRRKKDRAPDGYRCDGTSSEDPAPDTEWKSTLPITKLAQLRPRVGECARQLHSLPNRFTC